MAAAKSEGELDLLAPPGGPDVQQALGTDFQNQFGINVNYLSANGGAIIQRVLQERSAGQYNWDVYVGGSAAMLISLVPAGDNQGLDPALILPEVTNTQNWIQNKLWFADQGHTVVLLGLGNVPAFAVNPNMVDPAQFTSYKDLLDPQWDGKIGIGRDPRQPGPGQNDFPTLYENPALGPDYITALAKQHPVPFTDGRQALDSVGQGKLSILTSPEIVTTVQVVQQGVPIQLVPPQQLKEGGQISAAASAMTMLDRPPHPNAAKLYVNWALSKAAGTAIAQALGTPSLRSDVPKPDVLPAWTTPPVPGYFAIDSDQILGPMAQLQTLVNQVITQ